MRSTFVIWGRDLGAYLRTPMGYVILALALALDGMLFNAFAVGSRAAFSEDVLSRFFFLTSGVSAFASVFVAMRLVAEERQLGTLVLLTTSPVRDHEVVLGKFLAAFSFITLFNLLTVFMPFLIMIHGKIALSHVLAGYLGVLLLSAAVIAIGLFCSALAPNQLVALVLGAAMVGLFWLFWLISRIADPPLEAAIAYLSLHDKHFRPFMRGIVSIQDVVFYVSMVYVFLVATTRVLEARRWK